MRRPTVEEVINDGLGFKPEVLNAMREFRKLKPWRGTIPQRREKLTFLHHKLREIYERPFIELEFQLPEDFELPRGNGIFVEDNDTIYLIGKISVVTYLHVFAKAVFGPDDEKAMEWSINLYRRIFPNSAARMRIEGSCIVNPVNLN